MQFFHVNEEFPVSASHQLALITSLPFVHTARRYYRLNDRSEVFGLDARYSAPPGAGSSRDREDDRTRPFRGSKSRNKVSVGEPAEGSLQCASRSRARARRRPTGRASWPRARPRRPNLSDFARARSTPSPRVVLSTTASGPPTAPRAEAATPDRSVLTKDGTRARARAERRRRRRRRRRRQSP